MKDSTLRQAAAMPNAANTTTTNTIDLHQQALRPFTTQFRVRLANSVATGANSKNITYAVKASNEANGANSVTVQSYVVAGNAANHPASARELYLPPELNKRYLFATATGEADGGNAANGEFAVEIVI
jgi:hypothetical protein